MLPQVAFAAQQLISGAPIPREQSAQVEAPPAFFDVVDLRVFGYLVAVGAKAGAHPFHCLSGFGPYRRVSGSVAHA